MSNATDKSVKERLQLALARPLSKDWPTELHRDLLMELERLEDVIRCMTTDNDNHWTFRANQSNRLEKAIGLLREMRRAAGEDS